VAEASKLNIPIIAILDTNADPDPIDFPIAANDDAIKSIRILLRELVDAAIEARHHVSADLIEKAQEAERATPLSTYISNEPKER
jgi:small subunit ribosomal protein S2